jgi:hypothetical protein
MPLSALFSLQFYFLFFCVLHFVSPLPTLSNEKGGLSSPHPLVGMGDIYLGVSGLKSKLV